MRNDNNKLDFEQMLRTVEHAGRDARRQQELGDMIDRMAAAEERHHGFWWWGARVAAAACLVFFISTAIRVWFIPVDEPETPIVAAVDAGRIPTVQTSDPQPRQPEKAAVRRAKPTVKPANPEHPDIPETLNTLEITEEFYAEVPAEELPAEVTEEEPLVVEQDFAAAPVVEEQPAEPVAIAQTTPAPVPKPDVSKPTRRSFFGSLVRQAETSKMDGTMLAINIL